eukprot:Opistho-2@44067
MHFVEDFTQNAQESPVDLCDENEDADADARFGFGDIDGALCNAVRSDTHRVSSPESPYEPRTALRGYGQQSANPQDGAAFFSESGSGCDASEFGPADDLESVLLGYSASGAVRATQGIAALSSTRPSEVNAGSSGGLVLGVGDGCRDAAHGNNNWREANPIEESPSLKVVREPILNTVRTCDDVDTTTPLPSVTRLHRHDKDRGELTTCVDSPDLFSPVNTYNWSSSAVRRPAPTVGGYVGANKENNRPDSRASVTLFSEPRRGRTDDQRHRQSLGLFNAVAMVPPPTTRRIGINDLGDGTPWGPATDAVHEAWTSRMSRLSLCHSPTEDVRVGGNSVDVRADEDGWDGASPSTRDSVSLRLFDSSPEDD